MKTLLFAVLTFAACDTTGTAPADSGAWDLRFGAERPGDMLRPDRSIHPADSKTWPMDIPVADSSPASEYPPWSTDMKPWPPPPDTQPWPPPPDSSPPQPDKGSPITSVICSGDWCQVPAGSFIMGSPAAEKCRGKDEDLHKVTLTHAIEVARRETSQTEYMALIGYNPTPTPAAAGPDYSRPVSGVTWYDAQAYCSALSAKKSLLPCFTCVVKTPPATTTCSPITAYSGAQQIYICPGYRLPTEAEFEYLYRAGTQTPFYDPAVADCTYDLLLQNLAWFLSNTSYPKMATQPCGLKAPNLWSLYDMAGNVQEWTNDTLANSGLGTAQQIDPAPSFWAAGPGKIVRGGGFSDGPAALRAAARLWKLPTDKELKTGFRCVRTIKP